MNKILLRISLILISYVEENKSQIQEENKKMKQFKIL